MKEDTVKRWRQLLAGEVCEARDRRALAGLTAASKLYGAALTLHHSAYRLGLARRVRLPAFVVAIGNLTLGGTGKTTAAIAVADWLSDHGRRVAVLSRGYRGAGERGAVIVSEGVGPIVAPTVAGDEPYLLARALPGISVLVGKDRRKTGRLAVDRLGANALVLDDGFQYQRLVKDVDIVLVDALAPFGYDALIPRGLLREPVTHLRRATALWITHSDLVREADLKAIRERLRAVAPAVPVWLACHVPGALRYLEDGHTLELEALRGRRVLALSSIGNPGAFERMLAQVGAVVVGQAQFPDHHAYRAGEVREALHHRAGNADLVVTTEKDAVRLPLDCRDLPIWVLSVHLRERLGARPLAEELDQVLGQRVRP